MTSTENMVHPKIKTKVETMLVMAGGTGGHVFPALAVAKELSENGVRIVWLGTRKGIESTLVPKAGYDICYLRISGLVGSGLSRKLVAPFMLFFAILQSLLVILKERPKCVLGMGGFASGPGGIAAKFLNKKVIIHEQNAYAGLTNRKLAAIADSILTGFRSCEGLPETSIWVGNPVRKEIEIKIRTDQDQDGTFKILILGGSQGAKSLNENLPASISEIAAKQPIRVWHQTGAGKSADVNKNYLGLDQFKSVIVEEFITNIEVAYSWADIVICRAGAMTISELMAAGKPAVLIPFPYAAGDHQTKNARFMVQAEAAILIADDQLNQPQFTKKLLKLLASPEKLTAMSNNAAELHRPTAAKQVAEFCRVYLYA